MNVASNTLNLTLCFNAIAKWNEHRLIKPIPWFAITWFADIVFFFHVSAFRLKVWNLNKLYVDLHFTKEKKNIRLHFVNDHKYWLKQLWHLLYSIYQNTIWIIWICHLYESLVSRFLNSQPIFFLLAYFSTFNHKFVIFFIQSVCTICLHPEFRKCCFKEEGKKILLIHQRFSKSKGIQLSNADVDIEQRFDCNAKALDQLNEYQSVSLHIKDFQSRNNSWHQFNNTN